MLEKKENFSVMKYYVIENRREKNEMEWNEN